MDKTKRLLCPVCGNNMAVNDEQAVRAIEKRLTETDQSKAKAMEKERKRVCLLH